MELVLSFLLGFVSGLLYNEHIYRQARSFPAVSPLRSFLFRFSLLFVLVLVVAKLWGSKALISFIAGNFLARLLHILIRGLRVVRY